MVSLQAKRETPLRAGLGTRHVCVGEKNAAEPWRSALASGLYRFWRIIWNTAPKKSEKTALVLKLSPFTQLLLIRQRKYSSRSPSVCSPFFPHFFSLLIGPLSPFQQRTILKVYQQLLADPFLALCALFSGVSFRLLPPPRGPARKPEFCHGPVQRKWRNSSHAVSVITLPSMTHPASDYKWRIHSLHSPCHLSFSAGIN